ncbi:hypothetical protein CN97_11380 [Haematobacter massiliensis]|uniref:Uncharacterized protein n=1 Tax=Haematobacter massiliensis TaxID=195105 RepID=A0A086XSW1_9RHOB|nr:MULTISPECIES: hypothetical protein [Haematobacter]KFI25111.1 hypothetical protein CN97_11380 [Haematobacter massiliensis]
MTNDLVRKIASVMSKAMTLICVRNTCLETLHAGPGVVSHTGDYSDVLVTDANGRQIPWSEVSRISDDEMRDLMREIVNRLYTFKLRVGEQEFRDYLDRQLTSTQNWDEPRHDWNLAGRKRTRRSGLMRQLPPRPKTLAPDQSAMEPSNATSCS